MGTRRQRPPYIKDFEKVLKSGASFQFTNEALLFVNKTSGSATAVSLPKILKRGRFVSIKDSKGDAAANNITITDPAANTIDGQASLVINANYGAATLEWNGTEWSLTNDLSAAVSGGGSFASISGTAATFPIQGTAGANGTTGTAGNGGTTTIKTLAGGTATTGTGGNGGVMTVASGAGGATSGAAGTGGVGGALAITAGNGGATAGTGASSAGNGGAVTITSGTGGAAAAGTGNGGNGGNLNLVPGAGGTSAGGSAGAAGEVQVNGVSGWTPVVWVQAEGAAPSAASFTIFLATRAYRVKAISFVWSVASASGTATVTKDTSGAPGGGTALLTGTVSTAGSANAPASGTLIATAATLALAAGDRLALTLGGTQTGLAGLVVSVGLVPI